MPSPTHDALWHREIAELIERNGSLEVVVVSAPGHPDLPVHDPYKVRPFALQVEKVKDTLVVERFRGGAEAAVPCPVGSRLDVILVDEQMRYAAAYEVRDVEPYRLNDDKRVMSMRLKRVGDVSSAQRRASFRVDTATAGFGNVTINLPGPTGRGLKPTKGVLVNLSAGGMGLFVEGKTETITQNLKETFEVHLVLPNGEQTFVIPVDIRRCEPRRGRGVYLGLEFGLDTSQPEHKRVRETIARLTTDLQRDQLRKRRGA